MLRPFGIEIPHALGGTVDFGGGYSIAICPKLDYSIEPAGGEWQPSHGVGLIPLTGPSGDFPEAEIALPYAPITLRFDTKITKFRFVNRLGSYATPPGVMICLLGDEKGDYPGEIFGNGLAAAVATKCVGAYAVAGGTEDVPLSVNAAGALNVVATVSAPGPTQVKGSANTVVAQEAAGAAGKLANALDVALVGSGGALVAADGSGRLVLDYSSSSIRVAGPTGGPVPVYQGPAANVTLASVAASITSVLIATVGSAAPADMVVSVFNDSTSDLYLAVGSAASLTNFSVKIPPGGYYETPCSTIQSIYGIWGAAVGFARVTSYISIM
jgi:hypothetical protein